MSQCFLWPFRLSGWYLESGRRPKTRETVAVCENHTTDLQRFAVQDFEVRRWPVDRRDEKSRSLYSLPVLLPVSPASTSLSSLSLCGSISPLLHWCVCAAAAFQTVHLFSFDLCWFFQSVLTNNSTKSPLAPSALRICGKHSKVSAVFFFFFFLRLWLEGEGKTQTRQTQSTVCCFLLAFFNQMFQSEPPKRSENLPAACNNY